MSPDTRAVQGLQPAKPGSVAAMQYALITARPYGYTSDQVLFEVYVRRNAIAGPALGGARAVFLARPRACLRASPLVKTHGWGLHHDASGKVAAYAMETPAYRRLAGLETVAGDAAGNLAHDVARDVAGRLKVVAGMRNSKTMRTSKR